MDDSRSILSHGEREIAALRRQGYSVEEIAAERGESVTAIEKALDRIHDKTCRALVTLRQSPDTESVVAELDPGERTALRDRLAPDE